jgi:hypothetical protein
MRTSPLSLCDSTKCSVRRCLGRSFFGCELHRNRSLSRRKQEISSASLPIIALPLQRNPIIAVHRIAPAHPSPLLRGTVYFRFRTVSFVLAAIAITSATNSLGTSISSNVF